VRRDRALPKRRSIGVLRDPVARNLSRLAAGYFIGALVGRIAFLYAGDERRTSENAIFSSSSTHQPLNTSAVRRGRADEAQADRESVPGRRPARRRKRGGRRRRASECRATPFSSTGTAPALPTTAAIQAPSEVPEDVDVGDDIGGVLSGEDTVRAGDRCINVWLRSGLSR